MTFYDKTKSEENWKEEKSIKTINLIKKRRLIKIRYNLNNNLYNLLSNLLHENYKYKYIDSFLIFSIIYKIAFDLGISQYVSIYNCKNIIKICKVYNKIWIQDDKINELICKDKIQEQNMEKTITTITVNSEEHLEKIKFVFNHLFIKFNPKINKNRIQILDKKLCDSFLINGLKSDDKNSILEIENKYFVNLNTKKSANDNSEQKLKTFDKMNFEINDNLFELLCNLIEQNNYDYERKDVNSFLIFAIIYKFLDDLGIPEYISIYYFKGRIQICKEIINKKIGILEDKKNKIKLSNFLRKQDIAFNDTKKVEINTEYHFDNVIYTINNITYAFKIDPIFENPKFVKMFCDSFKLNNFADDENALIIKSKKNYEINNYKKIKTNENKREIFLKTVKFFEDEINKNKNSNNKLNLYRKRTYSKKKIKNHNKEINDDEE